MPTPRALRWSQFGISVWFVVVLFIGTILAQRPSVELRTVPLGTVERFPDKANWSLAIETWNDEITLEFGPRSLRWTVLAFVCLVGWKAASAARERQRARFASAAGMRTT